MLYLILLVGGQDPTFNKTCKRLSMDGTQATSITANSDHQQLPTRFSFLNIMVASQTHYAPNQIYYHSFPYFFLCFLFWKNPPSHLNTTQNFKSSLTSLFLNLCLGGRNYTQMIILVQCILTSIHIYTYTHIYTHFRECSHNQICCMIIRNTDDTGDYTDYGLQNCSGLRELIYVTIYYVHTTCPALWEASDIKQVNVAAYILIPILHTK